MSIATWEAVLVGVIVLLVLLWWGPGIKASVDQAPRGSAEDWKGVLLPLALVVGFVVLLLALA